MPILGATRRGAVEENLAALDVEALARAARAAGHGERDRPRLPASWLANEMIRSFLYGGLRQQIDA